MKYLKKRSTRNKSCKKSYKRYKKSCKRYNKSCKRYKKLRSKTVRRRHVMKGGWGITASVFNQVADENENEDDSLVGGNWVTLA